MSNADEEVLLEEKEMEVLRDTVREIQRSTTWRITFPIRVIPHLLRLVTGFAGRIFLILLSILGKLFNKVAKGVCKGMEGIDTFCDWIGPSTPNPETAEKNCVAAVHSAVEELFKLAVVSQRQKMILKRNERRINNKNSIERRFADASGDGPIDFLQSWFLYWSSNSICIGTDLF
ncbi:MAG: hypothetical protein ACLVEX_01185 [Ruthenibacterium lactatiformans]